MLYNALDVIIIDNKNIPDVTINRNTKAIAKLTNRNNKNIIP